jgi:hypothetical protein
MTDQRRYPIKCVGGPEDGRWLIEADGYRVYTATIDGLIHVDFLVHSSLSDDEAINTIIRKGWL